MMFRESITAFVSVATTSHIAFAIVALSSVSATSEIKRVLFLVGSDKTFAVTEYSGIEIRHIEDHLHDSVVQQIVSRYTPSEVCFALKPYIVRAVLEEGMSSVHYIDSDIRFFSNADLLEEQLSASDILLTPHYLNPFPDDGLKPNVLALLRGGVFNAGYIGVRNTPTALRFLEWWGNRVVRQGKNEPQNGTCGDQRWLDLVPVLFPGCKILRHPGANVAYWNLHERPLSLNKDVYECGGHKLLFFHFSGFNIDTPSKLSTYQNRINDSGHALAGLLSDYAQEIYRAREKGKVVSYAYARWWHSNWPFMSTLRGWLRKNW